MAGLDPAIYPMAVPQLIAAPLVRRSPDRVANRCSAVMEAQRRAEVDFPVVRVS
jgi:hypothetical protein